MEARYAELLKNEKFIETVADLLIAEMLPAKSLTRKQKVNWEQRWKRITTSAERKYNATLSEYFRQMNVAFFASAGEVTKGGEGSGEQEGHPFRGNQWTNGVQNEERIRNVFKENFIYSSSESHADVELEIKRFNRETMESILLEPSSSNALAGLSVMLSMSKGKVPTFEEFVRFHHYSQNRENSILNGTDSELKFIKDRYHRVLSGSSSVYKTTQQLLRERGVSEVKLYRGLTKGQNLKDGQLCFWSTNKNFAASFADSDGFVVSATVPIENIFYHNSTNDAVNSFYKENVHQDVNGDESLIYYKDTIQTKFEGKGIHATWLNYESVKELKPDVANALFYKFRLIFMEPSDAIDSTEKQKSIKREFVQVYTNEQKKSITKDYFSNTSWQFDIPFWQEMLQDYSDEFIMDMYEQIGDEVFKYLRYVSGDPRITGAFNVTDPNVQQFISGYSYQFAEDVIGTTVEGIRAAISQGQSAGLDMREIGKLVQGQFDYYIGPRALMIARTETIRSSNYAAIESYKQSGVVSKKEWLCTYDDRLCVFCASMDGIQIDVEQNFFDKDEEYTVGEGNAAQSMVFDYEDVAGPPAHPHCRCTLLPVVDEEWLQPEEEEPEEKRGLALVLKGGEGSGEQEGHPFRGNQYTDGEGGGTVTSPLGMKDSEAKAIHDKTREFIFDAFEGITDKHNKEMSQAMLLGKMINNEDFVKYATTYYGGEKNKRDEDSDYRALCVRDAIYATVKRWTSTSGDSDVDMVSMQKAVMDELGLKDTSLDHFGNQSELFFSSRKEFVDSVDETYRETGAAYRALVRTMYDETQKYFAEKGITELLLCRGVGKSGAVYDSYGKQTSGEITAQLNPMSSFSTDPLQAYNFIRYNEGGGIRKDNKGTMLFVRVPVSKVLCTPLQGYGCTGEREVVLLGGKYKMYSAPYDVIKNEEIDPASVTNYVYSELKRNHPETIEKRMKQGVCQIDADLMDADWAKTYWDDDIPEYGTSEFDQYLSDLDITLDHFKRLPRYRLACNRGLIEDDTWVGYKTVKGGEGSGEQEGHPFRGNQYTDEGQGGGSALTREQLDKVRQREDEETAAWAAGKEKRSRVLRDLKGKEENHNWEDSLPNRFPVLFNVKIGIVDFARDAAHSIADEMGVKRPTVQLSGRIEPSGERAHCGESYIVLHKDGQDVKTLIHEMTHWVRNKILDIVPTTGNQARHDAGFNKWYRVVSQAYMRTQGHDIDLNAYERALWEKKREQKGGAGSGEDVGHPFRGNQWTEGQGGGESLTQVPKENIRYYIDNGAQEWMAQHGIDKGAITTALSHVAADDLYIKLERYGYKEGNIGVNLSARWKSPGGNKGELRMNFLPGGAYVDIFDLPGGMEGKHAATVIMAAMEDTAKKAGITTVGMYADITIGCYAWARLGYDYASKYSLENAQSKLRGYITDKAKEFGIKLDRNKLNRQITAIKNAKEIAEFTLPGFDFKESQWRTNNMDVPEGMRLHLGKAFMLDRTGIGHGGWEAEKQLKRKISMHGILKGGEGSGEQEGHPFRGNQYSDGTSGGEVVHATTNEERDAAYSKINDIKSSLEKEGIRVHFYNPYGMETEKPVALAPDHVKALQEVAELSEAAKAQVQSVHFYPATFDMGEFTSGGKTWSKGGEYNSTLKSVMAKVFPNYESLDLFHHELGHAEFRTLAQAAVSGFWQRWREVKDEPGGINKILNAENLIKNPSTPEQEAYNFFTHKMRNNPEYTKGFISEYAESWKREPIVDQGHNFSFKREDGTDYTVNIGSAHRSANENYAEIAKYGKGSWKTVDPTSGPPLSDDAPKDIQRLVKSAQLYKEAQDILKRVRSNAKLS